MDVDWNDAATFAACTSSGDIYVCNANNPKPTANIPRAHSDAINSVRWDPKGGYLASCSDDNTVKIWDLNNLNQPVYSLSGHTQSIYSVDWSPATSKQHLFASAGTEVKIWDPSTGNCLMTLTKHTDPIYSVHFSPDGQYIASGSHDKTLRIWSTETGTLLSTYKSSGIIYDLRWDSKGEKIAVCTSDPKVTVLDLVDLF